MEVKCIINSNCRRQPEEVIIVSFRSFTGPLMEVMSIINSNCRRQPEEVIIVSFRSGKGPLTEVMSIINNDCRLRPEEIVYGTQHVARLLTAKIYCRRRLAKVIFTDKLVGIFTADTGLRK
jgi:hypothetical protein